MNQIENDPSILQHSPIQMQEGLPPYRFVLRHVSGFQPYVTYRENMRLENGVWKHSDFYWGHYFYDKESAEKDFHERAGGRYQ